MRWTEVGRAIRIVIGRPGRLPNRLSVTFVSTEIFVDESELAGQRIREGCQRSGAADAAGRVLGVSVPQQEVVAVADFDCAAGVRNSYLPVGDWGGAVY